MSKRPGDPGYAAGWCIFYRSPIGPKGEDIKDCEAGVLYESWRGAKKPCFLDEDGNSKLGALYCEHLRRPTQEEIQLHKEWSNKKIENLFIVMQTIEPWRNEKKGKSAKTEIECPICKGRLHLVITASKGHVHACCTTPECVSFIE